MYFNFPCSQCGKNLKVREELAGRKAKCPHCKASLIVPQPAPAPVDEFPPALDLGSLNLNDPLAGFSPTATATAPAATTTGAGVTIAAAQPAAAAKPQASASAGASSQDDGTNVSLVVTMLVGFIATLAFYGVLYPVPPSYLRDLFYDRGWVTIAEAFLMFWAIAILIFKSAKLKKQRSSMLFDVLPDEISKDITVEKLGDFTSHVRSLPVKPGSSFLIQRVQRGLEHFGVRHSASEVGTMLTSQSEIDNASVASSYAMLNVFIWAIPILGFIGTVQGLGDAVGNLSSSLEGAADVESIKQSLGAITGGLGVAFDTTLVALIMALFLKLPASSLQKSEEDLLTSVDDYCNENLLKRLQEPGGNEAPADPAGRAMQKAIDAAMVPHHAELRSWNLRLKEIGKGLTDEVQQGWRALQAESQAAREAELAKLNEVVERLTATTAAVSETVEKVAALQQNQAEQFTATAAALDSQGEVLEQQTAEYQARAEAQLGAFLEQSRLAFEPIAQQAEAVHHQVAASVAQSAASVEQSLANLQQAVMNLNDVLGQLGGQQVVIQSNGPPPKRWGFFGRRNGAAHG